MFASSDVKKLYCIRIHLTQEVPSIFQFMIKYFLLKELSNLAIIIQSQVLNYSGHVLTFQIIYRQFFSVLNRNLKIS